MTYPLTALAVAFACGVAFTLAFLLAWSWWRERDADNSESYGDGE